MRDPVKNGIVVRYVYPGSPAAKAGIAQGDAIVSVAGESAPDRFELRDAIGSHEVDEEIELEIRHGDAARKVQVTLAPLPQDLPPGELPASHGKISPNVAKKQAAVGAVPMKIAEFANEAWAYVPRGCHDGVPHGIVMWLYGQGGLDWDDLLDRWKPLCDRFDLILLAPKANDASKWSPGELPFLDRLLAEVGGKYPVDLTRIAICGQDVGGTAAFTAASRNRAAIRAVAAGDATPKSPMAESEPLERFAVYSAAAAKSRLAKPIESAVDAMRKTMIPVTTKGLGELPRPLTAEELAELIRWIDMLDRI
jgi:serine protease Do